LQGPAGCSFLTGQMARHCNRNVFYRHIFCWRQTRCWRTFNMGWQCEYVFVLLHKL